MPRTNLKDIIKKNANLNPKELKLSKRALKKAIKRINKKEQEIRDRQRLDNIDKFTFTI